jgi:hypothetical protein
VTEAGHSFYNDEPQTFTLGEIGNVRWVGHTAHIGELRNAYRI